MVCGPVVLELIGAFPGADHGARFPLLVISVAWVLLSIMTCVLGLSTIADVVDARAVDVGRREEGLVMATVSFVSKVASGMGVWIGGLVLTVIAFPGAGETDTIDAAVIERLGWWYAPLLTFVYAAAIVALYFYQLDRAAHRENIEALGRGREEAT